MVNFVLIFDVRVLGTAGQNVNDIFKVSTLEDRLEILEHTMKWSHIAPTAPDTLGKLYCSKNSKTGQNVFKSDGKTSSTLFSVRALILIFMLLRDRDLNENFWRGGRTHGALN